jgi:predicted ATPase/DNA-binding SARP family transcriptional activator
VEVRVLGPVELVGAEMPVRLAAMPRRLLAVLVVERGRTLGLDVLVEALWGERPPRESAKALQLYVSRLRKALPAQARIRTDSSGYALELDDDLLDAARFERLLAEARAASADGNAALALSLLDRALSLWRGQAFGEHWHEDFARPEAERLEELRLLALEERSEAQLRLGRHAAVVGELRELAVAHPLRERMQAQLMVALYRCGRQTEALDVYSPLQTRLRDELGLEPGAELRELQRRILQHDPALALAPAAPDQPPPLPAPPNHLLGRERELGDLRLLLVDERVRLLVLTGAGGSGKTRLALEAAHQLADSFANGACLVELAALQDPEHVPGAIARTLEIESGPGAEPFEILVQALRPRELLLVLDNAEHLREAAPLYSALVARAPRLSLLVTSRTVLHLSGEHVYPVEPLAEPAAITLFNERAREADTRFRPTDSDDQAITEICRRLDGLPLALELAASHTRTFSPEELLDRLESRLPLLTGGPRDLPARQRTLRATLEWSYDLLDEDEQRDLRRLAVFTGGCTLDAAEAVCDTTPQRLATLVEHNLLEHHRTPIGARYMMLETIREYALERLEESGEAEEIRRRHATHYVGDPLDVERLWLPPEAPKLFGRLNRELANVRGALDWAHHTQSPLELDLATLYQRGDAVLPSEGRQRLEAALVNPTPQRPRLRARALAACGAFARMAGDLDMARRHLENALRLYRELGDELGEHVALERLAAVAGDRGDESEEARLLDEFAERARRSGDPLRRAMSLSRQGARAFSAGNRDEARKLFEQSLQLSAGAGHWEALAHLLVADLAIVEGRFDDAVRACAATLELLGRQGHQLVIWEALGGSARALGGTSELEAAVRLHAAFVAWREAHEYQSSVYPSFIRELREYQPAALRAATTDPEFAHVAAEGRRMTLDEAIDCAREALARVARLDQPFGHN